MRARRLGSLVRVTVSEPEVYAFARRWPCAELPDSGIGFTFDGRGYGVSFDTLQARWIDANYNRGHAVVRLGR